MDFSPLKNQMWFLSADGYPINEKTEATIRGVNF
jgi:hypothetical protein